MPFLWILAFVLQAPPDLHVRTAGGWIALGGVMTGDSAIAQPWLAAALRTLDSATGLRVADLETRLANGQRNRIAVVDLDPAAWAFSLGVTTPAARRTAPDWLEADTSLHLAVNTGLFAADGTPLGLLAVDGVRSRPPVAWLDAVVALEDGRLRLTDYGGARTLAPGASAFQSLPWLVRDGRVVFGASGRRLSRTHRDRRLTLCLMPDGLVRLVLSNYEVFGATAGPIPFGLTLPEQVTVAAALGCRDAVALDGGLSAQLVVRSGPRLVAMRGWRRVPVMLLARTRPPR